jgi:pimeloyl-ACP methyl ester carboxylesterase
VQAPHSDPDRSAAVTASRKAARIRCPILLVVAEHDTIAPVGPALRLAERAPRAELFLSSGGHYVVYQGGEDHDRVLDVEVEFLHRQAEPYAETAGAWR